MEKKILIIDDEELYTDLLKKYIEELFPNQFRILVSNHPEQALTFIKKETVDFLITDLLMPRIDGEYLISTLKRENSDIPIILVTGADEIPPQLEDMKTGCVAIIRKPFSKKEISEVLNRVLVNK